MMVISVYTSAWDISAMVDESVDRSWQEFLGARNQCLCPWLVDLVHEFTVFTHKFVYDPRVSYSFFAIQYTSALEHRPKKKYAGRWETFHRIRQSVKLVF